VIPAAPVWTYWLASWWLAVDAVALTVIGFGYYRKVLRPRWELKSASARPQAPPAPARRGAAVGQPDRAAITSTSGERPARDLLTGAEPWPAEDERQPVSVWREAAAR
jgi:hypothetical protein